MSFIFSKICRRAKSSALLTYTAVRWHSNFHRTMAPTDEFFDVVINGAGLAGMATAISLAKSPAFFNRRILLVDKAAAGHTAGSPSAPLQDDSSKPGRQEKAWNARVVAINPSSMDLIDSWGGDAWDTIVKNGVGKMLNMKISDACSNASLSFGNGFEPLAWVVETSNLLSVFSKALKEVADTNKVTVRRATSISNVWSDHSGSVLNLKVDCSSSSENDLPLWTKLLIVADGSTSALREQLYFRKVQYDYNQLGIVATLKFAEANVPFQENTAWQRFLPTGPIALLPLDSSHCSLIWSAEKSFGENLLKLSEEEFIETLNDALTSNMLVQNPVDSVISQIRQLSPTFLRPKNAVKLPRFSNLASKRMTFPLRLLHALPVTQHRVVLVGDAAHTIHPLSGLGLNLGLGDIAELRRALEVGADAGDDIGTTDQLANFRFQRGCRSVPLAATTHFLHHVYSADNLPTVALRSLGVTILDLMPPIKNAIISQASDV